MSDGDLNVRVSGTVVCSLDWFSILVVTVEDTKCVSMSPDGTSFFGFVWGNLSCCVFAMDCVGWRWEDGNLGGFEGGRALLNPGLVCQFPDWHFCMNSLNAANFSSVISEEPTWLARCLQFVKHRPTINHRGHMMQF